MHVYGRVFRCGDRFWITRMPGACLAGETARLRATKSPLWFTVFSRYTCLVDLILADFHHCLCFPLNEVWFGYRATLRFLCKVVAEECLTITLYFPAGRRFHIFQLKMYLVTDSCKSRSFPMTTTSTRVDGRLCFCHERLGQCGPCTNNASCPLQRLCVIRNRIDQVFVQGVRS